MTTRLEGEFKEKPNQGRPTACALLEHNRSRVPARWVGSTRLLCNLQRFDPSNIIFDGLGCFPEIHCSLGIEPGLR